VIDSVNTEVSNARAYAKMGPFSKSLKLLGCNFYRVARGQRELDYSALSDRSGFERRTEYSEDHVNGARSGQPTIPVQGAPSQSRLRYI